MVTDTPHVTHDIRTQQQQQLIRTVPGGGWATGEKTAIIYCTGCELYVEQPAGQADVGAAVKQWEASR